MKLKLMLLTGTVVPALTLVIAPVGAAFFSNTAVAQSQPAEQDKREQRQEQRQEKPQEKRQEQRQEQRGQQQEQRPEQRGQKQEQRQERREERGDERREQRQEGQKGQQEQREQRGQKQEQRQERREERGDERRDQRQEQRGAGQQPSAAPTATPDNVRRLDDFRSQRLETREGNRVIFQEPGRTIVREGNRTIIRRNENERFRFNARDVRTERRGNETRTIAIRPDGTQIITVTDDSGRLIRRLRRDRGGRDIVIIDNSRGWRGPGFPSVFINVPPPIWRIPREQYIVEADRGDEGLFYDTFMAPPVQALERAYSLDEIRYSQNLRERMRRVDINTVTFNTGSWEMRPDQFGRLEGIARAIMRVIERNPNEVFLIEGHTDAVGSDIDNLSLSDRRAEAVAVTLTEQFGIPPENLTTQGYGEQYLKIPTDGPEEANRRVTARRITPLLVGQAGLPPPR